MPIQKIQVTSEMSKTLDYTSLDQVHKGNEATENYKLLKTLNLKIALKTRYNLLKYCELDTKAIVALFYKIRELLY